MSEVTKRQRDTSNTPEPESKRPNVEADIDTKPEPAQTTEQESDADAPSSPDNRTTMASDIPANPMNEEQDAVDLGSGVTADTSSSELRGDNGSVSNGAEGEQGPGSAGSVGDSSETQATQISMRTLIVTSDASIIIGKSGKHINEIRDKSNARLNIVSASRRKMTSRGTFPC